MCPCGYSRGGTQSSSAEGSGRACSRQNVQTDFEVTSDDTEWAFTTWASYTMSPFYLKQPDCTFLKVGDDAA